VFTWRSCRRHQPLANSTGESGFGTQGSEPQINPWRARTRGGGDGASGRPKSKTSYVNGVIPRRNSFVAKYALSGGKGPQGEDGSSFPPLYESYIEGRARRKAMTGSKRGPARGSGPLISPIHESLVERIQQWKAVESAYEEEETSEPPPRDLCALEPFLPPVPCAQRIFRGTDYEAPGYKGVIEISADLFLPMVQLVLPK